jgi:branched-chain amino acid transport system ATP-binding protein
VATVTALLEARALTKRFGGVVALDRLDLALAPNAILGLIGPNGSGKTTFFNVVTGIYGAEAGSIVFDGAEITHASPRTIHRAGISRTFQRSRLALPLSIFDNIMIGNHARLNQGLWFNLMRRGAFKREFEAAYGAARSLVEVFEPRLTERLFEPVAALPMIDRRRIEICRALISRPKLLLLDEPSAGLAPLVVAQVFDLVRRVRADGLTVLIVEQNVQQVLDVVDRAYLLEVGSIKLAGTSAELRGNDFIRKAYMGL